MKLTTTARHFEASPELIEHTRERLQKLKRYIGQIMNVHVIMSVEKFRHIAEINVHVNGHDFTATEQSEDMKASIDRAAKSLERQVKKFKGKIIANHQKPRRGVMRRTSGERIIRSGSVGSGVLEYIEQEPPEAPIFSIEEAIIHMEDKQENFLLFNNSESGKLNIVYRRADGHYGVIDTSHH
jgi:putative sigma-54 modulation protein